MNKIKWTVKVIVGCVFVGAMGGCVASTAPEASEDANPAAAAKPLASTSIRDETDYEEMWGFYSDYGGSAGEGTPVGDEGPAGDVLEGSGIPDGCQVTTNWNTNTLELNDNGTGACQAGVGIGPTVMNVSATADPPPQQQPSTGNGWESIVDNSYLSFGVGYLSKSANLPGLWGKVVGYAMLSLGACGAASGGSTSACIKNLANAAAISQAGQDGWFISNPGSTPADVVPYPAQWYALTGGRTGPGGGYPNCGKGGSCPP